MCGIATEVFAFYSSEVGRWMTRDLIEEFDGPNLYPFCENYPVNSFDLLGLKRWKKCYTTRRKDRAGRMVMSVDGGLLVLLVRLL